jgi:hypothetical protein
MFGGRMVPELRLNAALKSPDKIFSVSEISHNSATRISWLSELFLLPKHCTLL